MPVTTLPSCCTPAFIKDGTVNTVFVFVLFFLFEVFLKQFFWLHDGWNLQYTLWSAIKRCISKYFTR